MSKDVKCIVPDPALNQHVAVLGKTGSGKTYAAKGVVEALLRDKRQVCVLDPTAAWWGLRLAKDGKSPGFPVTLLGGTHADLPLHERSGTAVARLVTTQRASVIIDTSGFTVGEYTRWFIDFAGTLYTTIRDPLHLVIDEAHYFMPQGRGLDVEAGKMLHAGNRLMSGGRSRGIRAMMITQRPAKLHKDSLTCADTLIAMRVIAPQDREAIRDWVHGCGDAERGKQVLDSLAQLQRGEGWVWYPEGGHLERVRCPEITTYDSSATPKHGEKAAPTVGEIDLGEVRAALAEAVREAEANDPKRLRARIAELEREKAESRGATKALPDPGLIAEREARAAAKARAEVMRGLRPACVEIGRAFGHIERKSSDVASQVESARKSLEAFNSLMAAAATTAEANHGNTTLRNGTEASAKAHGVSGTIPSAAARMVERPEASSGLTGPQQAILDVIAMLNTRGIEADRDSVARWLAIHPNGGSYGANLGYLRGNGYLQSMTLTEQGRSAARALETGFEAALAALPDEPKRAILRAVADAGSPLNRDELAAALDLHPNGGSYGANLGWLRTMGLITQRGPIELTPGASA